MRAEVAAMMQAAWREPGFCVPNSTTYPHQWLWDSCFHSVIWAALGDERATVELTSALASQHRSGFVPHMTYWGDPEADAGFWGRPRTSSITQPPMYGHAAAVLDRAGFAVPDALWDRCRRGLRHLLADRPRVMTGLVPVFHPWETGCDDSLRWDDWCGGAFDARRWKEIKGQMVAGLRFEADDAAGGPVGSDRFAVGSTGFNALIVWNVRELASVGQAGDLAESADELADALAHRWNGETWTDADTGSGTARTLESLLGVLVDDRPEVRGAVAQQLADPNAFAAPFGPRGAHRDEEAADFGAYWRGSTWPQLLYLLEQAGVETTLALSGPASGWAEYWHPTTGQGRGASPQTWTGLALLGR